MPVFAGECAHRPDSVGSVCKGARRDASIKSRTCVLDERRQRVLESEKRREEVGEG